MIMISKRILEVKTLLCRIIDERVIAKRRIANSLKIEEGLVNLLRNEVKILNRKSNDDIDYCELQKIHKTLRYIIYAISVLDERVQKSLDILKKTLVKYGAKYRCR